MGATRGIHIIWTTYGTWLPGDPRGHWSALFDLYGQLKQAGHKLNLPDVDTYNHARSLMKEPAKTLNIDEMRIVADVLGSYIAPELSGVGGDDRPICRACAIEATHVHLLVGRCTSRSASSLDASKARLPAQSFDSQTTLAATASGPQDTGKYFCSVTKQSMPSLNI